MVTRTRYFVIASLLVLTVGIGTALVAHYVSFPTNAFSAQSDRDELQFIPRDAVLVAFASVQEVMTSDLRQKMRQTLQGHENGRREFENRTGISVETDIDRVVACLAPPEAGQSHPRGMVVARGRFDAVRIEALMREHGARVEEYQGARLLVAAVHDGREELSLAFLEPGLVAVGSSALIRSAVSSRNGGDNITTNDDMMKLIGSLDGGNAWAVGRFDALRAQAKLPAEVEKRLPPITWFAASGNVNGGLSVLLRAETLDEESANNLRDVVRGFLALARLQTASQPALKAALDSIELSGTGNSIALSFSVPSQVFDLLGKAAADPPSERVGQ